jgi:hypothetical protein
MAGIAIEISPETAQAEWNKVLKLRATFPLNSATPLNFVWFPTELLLINLQGVSPWASISNTKSGAPRLFLTLLGLSHILGGAKSSTAFVIKPWDASDEFSSKDATWDFLCFAAMDAPIRRISISTLLGRRENVRSGMRNGRSMAKKLTDSGLARYEASKLHYKIELLSSDGRPIRVSEVQPTPERGLGQPWRIALPLSFITNGWAATLSNKETHTFLALMYQRERTPSHGKWFVSTSQRALLGIDDKAFQVSTRQLVKRGLISPVDANRFAEESGHGSANDRPHEFYLNLDSLEMTPNQSMHK